MAEPYIKRKAGDFITAQDWNEMQRMIRDFLNKHSHGGGDDQGPKLKSEAFDNATPLTVAGLNVTGDLKVGGGTVVDGAFSVSGLLTAEKDIRANGTLTVEKKLAVDGNVTVGTKGAGANLSVVGGIHVGGKENPGENNLWVDGDIKVGGALLVSDLKSEALSKVTPVYIRGTGLNHNASRQLIIGGSKIYDKKEGRGLSLTIVSKSDFSVVSTTDYDTYGKPADSKTLAEAMNKVGKGQMGVLTSYDAWERSVTDELKAAFRRFGLFKALGTPIGPRRVRRPYAAIFEGSSSDKVGTAKAVEVLHSADKNAPFAEIRGWLIDGSFMATGTVPNALANNLGTAPALLVNESNVVDISGRVDIHNPLIRKVAVSTGLGPNDGTDQGQIKSRLLTFTKVHSDTAIRILYCDNLRVNVVGKKHAARWEIRVDGKTPPGGAIYQDKYGISGNYHHPTTIVGYAVGLAAGKHTIGIWVGPVPGYEVPDAYTGWSGSRWTIEAEECWI